MSETCTQPHATLPAMVDLDELARMLNVSRSVVARMRRDGRLLAPALEMDKVLRWGRAEVLAWIDAGCPEADAWAKSRSRGRAAK